MKEAICKKCKAVYVSDKIPENLICFCDSNEFKVNVIEKAKKLEEENLESSE